MINISFETVKKNKIREHPQNIKELILQNDLLRKYVMVSCKENNRDDDLIFTFRIQIRYENQVIKMDYIIPFKYLHEFHEKQGFLRELTFPSVR
jgi:hypothetical protein